jgi:hypothetical protein
MHWRTVENFALTGNVIVVAEPVTAVSDNVFVLISDTEVFVNICCSVAIRCSRLYLKFLI